MEKSSSLVAVVLLIVVLFPVRVSSQMTNLPVAPGADSSTGIPGKETPQIGLSKVPLAWAEATEAAVAAFDKVWPPSDSLKGYRDAHKLYNEDRFDEGLQIVRRLVMQPLVLLPDGSTISAKERGTKFFPGRLFPLQEMLITIHRINGNQARSFSEKGDAKKALDILKTNILLAEAVVHVRPNDYLFIEMGNHFWPGTWRDVARIFRAQGRQTEAAIAEGCVRTADDFRLLQLTAYLNGSLAQLARIENKTAKLPQSKRDKYGWEQMDAYCREELAALRWLVQRWDIKVNVPVARKLLSELQ